MKDINKIFFNTKTPFPSFFSFKLLIATNAILLLFTSFKYLDGKSSYSFFHTQEIAATLELTKSVSNPTPESGETFIYTLQYRCASTTDDCMGTYITDPLPPEVQFVSLVNSAHVASSSYNSGSHTVTFTFVNPLSSGTSGQVEIHVQFPNGTTANGTTASNAATIAATNATAVTTSNVLATASAQTKTYFGKFQEAGGAAGGTISYSLRVCNTSSNGSMENGTLQLGSISIRDTFPANTTFLGAINAEGSSYVYDAPSHSITFTLPNPLNTGECAWPKVSLGVPSPPFNIGDVVNNNAAIYFTPYGGSPTSEYVSNFTTLTSANFEASTYKSASNTNYYQGNGGYYNIGLDINGTENLDNFCIIDTIPNGLIIEEIHHGGYYYGGIAGPNNAITISYETNLGGPYTISGSPFLTWESGDIDVEDDLGLPSDNSEYITVINWCFGNTYSGLGTWRPIRLEFEIKTDAAVGTITNCAEMTTTTSGVTLNEECVDFTINPALSGFRPSPRKQIKETTGDFELTHAESLSIGDTTTFRLRIRNSSSSVNDIPDPIAVDFLPEGLEYISGSWTFNPAGTGAPNPIFSETTNFNGSGRSLLKWEWTGASSFGLPRGESMYIEFDAKINNLAPPGYNTLVQEFALLNNTANSCSGGSKKSDADDLDEDGNTTEEFCFEEILLNVDGVVGIESEMLIKGQLDSTWTKYPASGLTVPGGVADYLLEIRNLGNVALDSIIIIDILPFVGDAGVVDLTNRDSRWQPNLVSTVHAPSGVTVYYSTEGNPCRDSEGVVSSGPVGCTAAGWTTTPADLTTVRSLKFEFGSTIIEARDTFSMEWSMRAPGDALTTIGAQPDSIAWNSFGYIAQRVDNGDTLLPAEPVKVGMKINPISPNVYGDYVWNDINQNGRQNGGEPGIDGVRVELYKDNGDGIVDITVDTFINFTLTAGGGYYLFPNLDDGDYYSIFYKPLAMNITTNDAGGNDAIDSDGVGATLNGYDVAITPIVTLNSMVYDLDWDIGFYSSADGAIGNYVWNDQNNDGIQNESAADGVNGIRVFLYNAASSSQPYASTITTNDLNGNPGYYYFDNVPAADYSLRVDIPVDASFTIKDAGAATDATDSDFEPTSKTTDNFTVVAGTYHNNMDAGLLVSSTEVCGNGLDDDGDGNIDCADVDCSGGDNDGDGICDFYDLDDDNDGILDDVEALGISSYDTICSIDQFDFSNPTLESGVDETVGAIYRYSNVITGIDALVEIVSMTNATLDTIDSEGATGFLDAFQPIIRSTATGTVGIEFNFKFVNVGTSTLSTSINRIGGTAYDLDGTAGARMESYRFEAPVVAGLDEPTFLQMEQIGSDLEFTSTGLYEGSGIDSDPRLRLYFLYKDTSEFTVHIQQKVVNGLGNRFYCLRFDECEVSDFESINLFISEGTDTDGDGIDNHLDLDSDNDGIFDVDEAGHTALDSNNDGIIDGANILFGTNGVFDALETYPDSDSLNYIYSDSETTPDNLFDFWELDSDGDGCTDAEEEGIVDSDTDGIAGTGTPIVDANGLVTSITYASPSNNTWQNPSVGSCLAEICNNGIDDDNNGITDCPSISGNVFEDINYGGGSGRNFATADASAQASGWAVGDIGVQNARVELYDNTGAFVTSTVTDAAGDYSLLEVASGTYYIRLVNGTVSSNRGSNFTGQTIIPIQTFRSDGTNEIKNEIGGVAPSLIDAGVNNTSTNISTLTTGSTIPQSVTSISVGTSDTTGIDFGYNFDVIVNTNDSGQGSLRQFILNSNELTNTNLNQEDNPTGGVSFPKNSEWETSIFMINGVSVQQIQPTTVLPDVIDEKTHLTGYTQNGSTQGTISARDITIELHGGGSSFNGLNLRADSITISGLAVHSFNRGIYANQTNSEGIFVWGNYIGTHADGTTIGTNSGTGIYFYNVNNSFIGTDGNNVNDVNEGNLVSNSYDGINIRGTENMRVAGNYVGTDKHGTVDFGNRYLGVNIRDAADENIIGFDDAATNSTAIYFRNLISGNGTDGVRLTNSNDQIISGNYIGTDISISNSIPNSGYGVQFVGTCNNNLIGTNANGDDDEKERNIISGNLSGFRTSTVGIGNNNVIAGNYFGTDATGNIANPNQNPAISINSGQTGFRIGTNGDNLNDAVEGNVISGNDDDGIRISGATNTLVAGNKIGVGADGITLLGNGKRGIFITSTANNTIVGYTPTMANTNELEIGNFIKNNDDAGIGLAGSGLNNRISRNQISNNDALGIDLAYDSVTPNDNGDGDSGTNNLLNFPVFESANLVGNNLTIIGFAPAGAEVEFFIADAGPNPSPLPVSYTTSFGEGATYLFTGTEGGGNDTDATTGNYTDDGTGAVFTKTQNRFEFTFDVTGLGLSSNSRITSTATDGASNTSEFSGVVIICINPVVNNAILSTCDNSNETGFGTFYLFDINSSVSSESGVVISYHPTLLDAQNGTNLLTNPHTSSNAIVFARIENISTGCFSTAEITLDIGSVCLENCNNGIDEDGDGLIDCDDPDCPCCESYAPTLNNLNKNDP